MTNTGKKIFKASLAVILAHIIFKLGGQIQARMILIYCQGDKSLMDLLFWSFDLVLMSFYLVGEEGLGPAFLPVFMEEKHTKGEKQAWVFAGTIISCQFVVLICFIIVVMLYPKAIVNLMTDWDSVKQSEAYLERSLKIVRWIIPALLALSLGSTTYLLLNSYKRFFLAALGDSAVKLMIIAMVAIGFWQGSVSPFWFCAGVCLGSLAKVLTHLSGLYKEFRQIQFNFNLSSPAGKKFILLVLPLLVGIIFAKVRDIFNGSWILSQLTESGLIAINQTGRKLFQSIGWILPYSVSIAMYPFFCELVDKENRKELANILSKSCRIIILLVIPVAAITIALALPLSRVFFQVKGFGLPECRMSALSSICYTAVLPFFALEYIFMQAFFSNRKMTTPIIVGFVFSSLSIILSYLGTITYGKKILTLLPQSGLFQDATLGTVAIMVVACSYTLTRSFKVITLGILLKRFLPALGLQQSLRFALKIILAGAVTLGTAYLARQLTETYFPIPAQGSFIKIAWSALPILTISSTFAILSYLLSLRLFCYQELKEVINWTTARLQTKAQK